MDMTISGCLDWVSILHAIASHVVCQGIDVHISSSRATISTPPYPSARSARNTFL